MKINIGNNNKIKNSTIGNNNNNNKEKDNKAKDTSLIKLKTNDKYILL